METFSYLILTLRDSDLFSNCIACKRFKWATNVVATAARAAVRHFIRLLYNVKRWRRGVRKRREAIWHPKLFFVSKREVGWVRCYLWRTIVTINLLDLEIHKSLFCRKVCWFLYTCKEIVTRFKRTFSRNYLVWYMYLDYWDFLRLKE